MSPNIWKHIVLSSDYVRLLNGCKTEDLVLMCENMGILPPNHFGGRPGRATTDLVHLMVKMVKDAWRKGEVASLLCLDMKGVFLSTAVDVLKHEMHQHGVPEKHIEWLGIWKADRPHLFWQLLIWVFCHWRWTQPRQCTITDSVDHLQPVNLAYILEVGKGVGAAVCGWCNSTGNRSKLLHNPWQTEGHHEPWRRDCGVGYGAQLFIWNQEIPTHWPVMTKDMWPFLTAQVDTNSMGSLHTQWPKDWIDHDSQVLGITHWQRVEMEGTVGSSTGKGAILAREMQ